MIALTTRKKPPRGLQPLDTILRLPPDYYTASCKWLADKSLGWKKFAVISNMHITKLNIYKKEKSLKMKGDVGMACQKVHKQGRIKVMVSIQSLIHPYIFSQRSKDVGMGLCILTITQVYPSLFVYFLARHSYISFHF